MGGHCFKHISRGLGGPPDVGAKLTFGSLSLPFLDITVSFFIDYILPQKIILLSFACVNNVATFIISIWSISIYLYSMGK